MCARITKHGKRRIKERISTEQTSNSLMRTVLKNGKDTRFYQGKFRQYLESKIISGIRAKIYNDNVYLLSKNKKRLITTYPVPEKYLPTEQFEIPNDIITLAHKIKINKGKPVIIKLKTGLLVSGYIDNEYNFDDFMNFSLISDGEYIQVKTEDVDSVEVGLLYLNDKDKETIGIN